VSGASGPSTALARPVDWLLAPHRAGLGGQAFGLPGRRKTYLTMSVWRSFVAVVILPFLALLLHPQLLWRPLQWEPPNFGPVQLSALVGLAALTGIVYLTRNAVLRVREVEADSTAHAVDRPGGRCSGPPWLRCSSAPR
jgi:hypothetical protein